MAEIIPRSHRLRLPGGSLATAGLAALGAPGRGLRSLGRQVGRSARMLAGR